MPQDDQRDHVPQLHGYARRGTQHAGTRQCPAGGHGRAAPSQEFTSQRMYEVMDLCVACKACKAECPSSVDMAKIKFEFLAHYYQAHGTPLRARLFGHIARLSRLSSGPLAPLANFGTSNPLLRRPDAAFAGYQRERTLPTFARQPFTDLVCETQRRAVDGAKRVVLFNDTFNTYNYPQIGSRGD